MKYLPFLFLSIILACSSSGVKAQYEDPQSHQCLQCHSSQTYTYENTLMMREEKRLMNPFYIMDTIQIRLGVHSAFDCTTCHSYDYTSYPHPAAVKLEPMMVCLDCHAGGGSEFQFETIQEEFHKSVHYQEYQEGFTCSKCHDIHTYRPVSTTSSDVQEIVEYSNGMCLSCHDNMVEYNLVSGRENPEIVQIHDWLPNQELHFENVRCIECHTEVDEGLLVSHNILHKESAVRQCAECHSENSLLQASLYKYQNLQQRAEDGTLSSIISNQAYVIGTHQVPFLQTLGLIITLLLAAGIGIHVVFRIINKK